MVRNKLDHPCWERFSGAAEYLATAFGPVRERSVAAYCQYIAPLTLAEFDSKTRPKFERLQKIVEPILEQVYANPARLEHHDAWELAARLIRNSTGQKIAKLIYAINEDIQDESR